VKHRGLLLDTQAFLLLAQEKSSLPSKVSQAFLDKRNTLYLSLVSLWELQIKLSLGKVKLPVGLPEAVQRAVSDAGMELLQLHPEHVYKLRELPFHHRDPFDRLLAAQALHERLTILGGDKAFDDYGVTRIW
jgi:PIN domain nuclease of toxin-antitoxin system